MTHRLQASLGNYPHFAPLFDGVTEVGKDTELEAVEGTTAAAFGGMLERLAYDICELPFVNYLAARELGFAATAIPVFPVRRFIHRMIEVPIESEITEPRGLEGRRVATGYHGNSDAVWARGILKDDYGVDLSTITWVTVRDERVAGSRTPEGIEHLAGADIDELLASGSVDAKITAGYGAPTTSFTRFIWSDVEAEGAALYETTRLLPILHTLVVRDDVLADHPLLANDLVAVFERAKQQALEASGWGEWLSDEQRETGLKTGFPFEPPEEAFRRYLGRDPLPYRLDANATVLEKLISYALDQEVIRVNHDPVDLFASL